MCCGSMSSVSLYTLLVRKSANRPPDHDAPKWALGYTDLKKNLMQWRMRLSEFKLDVVHCDGRKYQATNALSGLKTIRTDQTLIETDIAVLCISVCTPERRGKGYVYERLWRIKRQKGYWTTWIAVNCDADGPRTRQMPDNLEVAHIRTGKRFVLSPSVTDNRTAK